MSISQPDELAALRSELATLRSRSEAVGEQLGAAARELQAGGTLPSVALVDELDIVRSRFADLRRSTLKLVAEVGPDKQPSWQEVTSLSALEQLMDAAGEAIERRGAARALHQALSIVDRVLLLRHRQPEGFQPLEVCQEQARQLRQTLESLEWPATHAEMEPLAEGRHPLACLIELVERRADLDDARWEVLFETLGEAFGRPLAVAAARGNLWLPRAEGPGTAAPNGPPLPRPGADEDDWPTFSLAWEGQSTRGAAALGQEAGGDGSSGEAGAGERGARSGGMRFTGSLTPAHRQRQQAVSMEEQGLPSAEEAWTLVWEGLLHGRTSAAYVLATYADDDAHSAPSPGVDPAATADAGSRASVPTWVLRAVALGPYVAYASGDVADELRQTFASAIGPRPEARWAGSRGGVSPEVRALRLLLLAAALRPALVAPSTGAWKILRDLPTDPSLPLLHRYSGLIADYGERETPASPHTFAPSLAQSAWRDMLEDLLREIGAWRVRFLGMRTGFPPATEVWRRWLRPDGLVHGLLAPLTIDPHGLDTARGLVERLSGTAQIRSEIADTDRRLIGRTSGPDITSRSVDADQLVERVREAVEFARRWAALQEHRPGRPEDDSRRQASRLKQQLAELRPGLSRELAEATAAAATLPLRAALAQCGSALTNLEAVLGEPARPGAAVAWLPIEEPAPGMLLHADLLHVPRVELDATWHVLRPDSALIRRGLRSVLLAVGPPDWKSTFELHMRQHDHLATAQVIECVELHDPTTAAELSVARAEDLEHLRSSLRSEVELTREAVDLRAAAGGLDEHKRARLLTSVERIRLTLPSVLRFAPSLDLLGRVRAELNESAARPAAEVGTGVNSRRAAGAAAVEPDGTCLIVGLPQQDASTVLNEAAQAYAAQGRDQVALVVDATSESPWTGVMEALGAVGLTSAGAAAGPSRALNEVSRQVQAWLDEQPSRRLLLLVDHADAVLEEEEAQAAARARLPANAAALFPTSSTLARLMQSREGRVKVVLAGSLSVLRAARLRQYPLADRGYMCLRPMLDDGGWREAAALLRECIEGEIPISDAVVARALSVSNYEPGTIRELGSLLSRRAPDAPISTELLEAVISSRDGAYVLTGGLAIALQRDPRQAVLVYCLALASWAPLTGEASEVGQVGVSRDWLRDQLSLWWEQGARETWSEDSFQEVLDELLDLGLVSSTEADRFCPGNPNLAALLGSQDELIARLSEYGNQTSVLADESKADHDYAPACFRPALESGPAGRSPLTDGQLSRLLRASNPATIIFGTQAAGLASVEAGLHAVVGLARPVIVSPSGSAGDCAALLQMIDAATPGPASHVRRLVLVGQGWHWDQEWVVRVLDHLANSPTSVTFLADPGTTWRLLQQRAGQEKGQSLPELAARGVARLSLGPWRESLVRQWAAGAATGSPSGADLELLYKVTGGWPVLLEQCGAGVLEPCLRELAEQLTGSERGRWSSAFGLDLLPAVQALRPLAMVLPATEGSLAEQVDASRKNRVAASLEWAWLLGLARPLGGGRWGLDPVAARLLQDASPTSVSQARSG